MEKKPPTDCSIATWQSGSTASCILEVALPMSLPNGKRIYLPPTSFSGKKIEKKSGGESFN
jgi:hypothetical protein